MPMIPFDLYIGIDWSGARAERLPNMAVARWEAGSIKLVDGPSKGCWSRGALTDWLLDLSRSSRRVLCGADFSFCFPFTDHGAYFPGIANQPSTVVDMWRMVETVCTDDPHLGADSFLTHPAYGLHFFSRGSGRVRLRATEQACATQGFGTPETIFKIVGPKQVAKSSLTGMRVLHRLKLENPAIAVWPFDDPADAPLVMVETYPAAFVHMAGQGGGKVRDAARLNAVMDHFGVGTVEGASLTDDQSDALVTAAALRHLAGNPDMWHPPGLSDRVRHTEGWTFGIGVTHGING